MSWTDVLIGAVLLSALGAPVAYDFFRGRRRASRVHSGHRHHWYVNFSDKLEYEPMFDEDIRTVRKDEMIEQGYRPTKLVHRVPRTFRGRITGDEEIRLWKADRAELPPAWLCDR
jgi:hypothetical protein